MPVSLFNPVKTLDFDSQTCFLTGRSIAPAEEQVPVFPEWVMDRYSLRDKKFKMLDQVTGIQYQDLKMPCSREVKKALGSLEDEIKKAFIGGYEEVIKVSEKRLFQWMAKLIYGVLYHDFSVEKKRLARKEEKFELSPFLQERFGMLHLMLQSLVAPMEFKGPSPWSIRVVKVRYSKDLFNYKDEPTNLNFSLGMNNFGIVACLQDNGAVGIRQQEMMDKIAGRVLHPVQFEELCGRFIYTNYLLKHRAGYNVQTDGDKTIVEAIPLRGTVDKPLFAPWDDDMFARVLAEYWKPWGITKGQIVPFSDSPVSYLENDYTHEFIEADSISLPY